MKSILLVFATLTFSLNCIAQITLVPDDNFEQALIDLGYDSGPLNGFVFTADIENIIFLNVDGYSISDLSGIEDFEDLQYLVVSFNNLTTLDLRFNSKLIHLACNDNNLSSLNVRYNSKLRDLICVNNNLTSLNLGHNVYLETLICWSNDLINLNVKNGKNARINTFITTNNPNLSCIRVDDPAYSELHWTSIDPASSFSEDCRFNRMAIEAEEQSFSVFPNPVNEVLTVSTISEGNYVLHTIDGKRITNGQLVAGSNSIDVSSLYAGLYILTMNDEETSIQKKILKN